MPLMKELIKTIFKIEECNGSNPHINKIKKKTAEADTKRAWQTCISKLENVGHKRTACPQQTAGSRARRGRQRGGELPEEAEGGWWPWFVL